MRRPGTDPTHTELLGQVDDLARLAERARRFHPRVYEGGARTELWVPDPTGASVWARLGSDRPDAAPKLVVSVAGRDAMSPAGDLAVAQHAAAWSPGVVAAWTMAVHRLLENHQPVQRLTATYPVCKKCGERWPCADAAPFVTALTGRAPLVVLVSAP